MRKGIDISVKKFLHGMRKGTGIKMNKKPQPFEVYRHFKGNLYQVINIAYHSETMEEMVVYQQLYSPFKVFVRPLAMFMSPVDEEKYPDASQKMRFELQNLENTLEKKTATDVITETASMTGNVSATETVNVTGDVRATDTVNVTGYVRATETVNVTGELNTAVTTENEEPDLHPLLLQFLDADTYEEKLDILTRLHKDITDDMINTIAVCLDTEIKDGELEERYKETMNCLLTLEKFECNRLR